MKKILILALALSFTTFSCKTIKTNNIHVDHRREKDQYKTPADKKYQNTKKSKKTKKKLKVA